MDTVFKTKDGDTISIPTAEIDALKDIFEPEELDPELQKYFVDDGMPCIKHPLVFSIMHAPPMNRMMNQSLRHKKAALERAIREEEWGQYINIYERPHRVDALLQIAHQIKDRKVWWELLGDTWTDSENIWQLKQFWEYQLSKVEPESIYFMDEDDRAALAAMTFPMTVWRGAQKRNKAGFSWTTDREKAKWFSTRLLRNRSEAILLERTVAREHVFAYMSGRSEEEIVLYPSALSKTRVTQSKI